MNLGDPMYTIFGIFKTIGKIFKNKILTCIRYPNAAYIRSSIGLIPRVCLRPVRFFDGLINML